MTCYVKVIKKKKVKKVTHSYWEPLKFLQAARSFTAHDIFFPYLLEVGAYLEQEFPSQAQYGSLARQQSAQAFPYV